MSTPAIPIRHTVDSSINDFRLTLTSGTPVTTSDTTGSTIYAEPNGRGNQITLLVGGRQRKISSAAPSVAVPSTVYRPFDIFGYYNAGALAIECLSWADVSGSITNATNATPIVVTSAGHGLSNGDIIYIVSVGGNTAANGIWQVANVAADTFELVGSAGSGAYTSGGTWRNLRPSRATAIVTNGTGMTGIYTKSGDPTRRYLGTGMTNATSGQCEDSRTKRFLYNAYNQVHRLLHKSDGTLHTWTSATYRIWNNDKSVRTEMIVGLAEQGILGMIMARLEIATGESAPFVGIARNKVDNADSVNVTANVGAAASSLTGLIGSLSHPFDALLGYSFFNPVEFSGATSADFLTTSITCQFEA